MSSSSDNCRQLAVYILLTLCRGHHYSHNVRHVGTARRWRRWESSCCRRHISFVSRWQTTKSLRTRCSSSGLMPSVNFSCIAVTLICLLTIHCSAMQHCVESSCIVFAYCHFNPFSTTIFLILAKMSVPKHSAPYWFDPPFQFLDTRALWRSVLSARVPECQEIKNGGLDQYGAEHFEV